MKARFFLPLPLKDLDKEKRKEQIVPSFCVGTTYLSGPSPDKYFRQKRA